MVTQKVIIALVIICLAVIVASILKFAEKSHLRLSFVTYSLLMPISLPMFMVVFFAYVYKKEISSLALHEKIISTFRFILLEVQIIPLIHTKLIETIYCIQKESNSKIIFQKLQKNTFAKAAVEDLHVRFSFANKLA